MRKKLLLDLAMISMLSVGITSCGNKGDDSTITSNTNVSVNPTSSDENQQSSSEEDSKEYLSISQDDEVLGLIPQEVLDANVDIDFLIYIEGQDSAKPDIGNYCWDESDPNYASYRYHPEDVSSVEMARWFGAAQAFKKIAPNVKINLKYCNSRDYDTRVQDYVQTYGHYPELMWTSDKIITAATNGWVTDLSRYQDSEYYQQFSEFLLSRYNLGGLQAAFPMSTNPWGFFVNLDILSDPTNPIVINYESDDGYNSDEYIDWIDNLTYETYLNAIKQATNSQHAGISQMSSHVLSYAVGSIYDSFVSNGTVDLASDEQRMKIQRLLEMENEMSHYSVYPYDEANTKITIPYYKAKSDYPEAHNWSATKNFCKDQYSLFMTESPWGVANIANYIMSNSEDSDIVKNIDFIPYPRVSEDDEQYTAVGVGGLVVGEQCPIEDGVRKCFDRNSELKMDVAAYFTMFADLDPRSIDARNKVQYVHDGTRFTGDLDLPLCKKGSKFSWQYDDDVLALYPDPAEDFDDNWSYQLYNWLNKYRVYLTNDEEPDIKSFSNIRYGLYKQLNALYMLDQDYISAICYNVEPDTYEQAGELYDLFDEWDNRYVYYAELNDSDGTYSGVLGSSTYVSTIMSHLSDIETKINSNTKAVWEYIKDKLSWYYYDEDGDALYPDADDRSYRTNYEGSRFA